MKARFSPAAPSPACRSPGAPPRAMTILAATISSGRATSSRPPVRCSLAARSPMPGARWTICASSRRRTGTGRKTPGSTARPIGAARSSMKPPFPSCCSISPSATARCRRRSSPNTGPWSNAPAPSSSATAPPPGRTAGRKVLATRPPPSRWKSPPCSPRPSSRIAWTHPPSPPSCATPRMPGTRTSRTGSTSPARTSPGSAMLRATICASPRRAITTSLCARRMGASPRITARRARATSPRTSWSAPTPWPWSASACARRTTRASATRSPSSTT